jgi:SWI/SNF-related matrix-associated actin-dependent regulator 1 of chromatin subfamily A
MEKELVMQINGLKANGAARWVAPLRWAIYVDAASTIQKYRGEVSDAAKQWGNAEGARVKALIAAKYAPAEKRILGTIELFESQVSDAEWLTKYDKGSGLLFGDMRTGKSFTVLELIEIIKERGEAAFPIVIVCPPGVTFEWELNLENALPERSRAVLSNGMTQLARTKALQENPDIVVLGYNLVWRHSKVSYYGGLKPEKRQKEIKQGLYEPKELQQIAPRTVVLDEAHNVKDPKSQQTRACWELGDKADRRIILTGTPTSKKETGFGPDDIDISDMWALFRFVYPLDFPARSKFNDKYLLLVKNFFGIPECRGLNPENKKFWEMVFEPMYLRRKRSIKTQKEYRIIPVELTGKQKTVYKQLEKHGMADIDGELLIANDGLTERQRKLQASLATLVLDKEGNVVGMQEPSAILDALFEWIDEREDKAIVFSDSALFFRLIEDKFTEKEIRFVSFPGGLSNPQKVAVLKAFRENEDVRLILVSLRAGNAGIDMSAAKRIAYASLADDPVIMAQSEDRNLGPTQDADISEVAFFLAKNTVAEEIHGDYLKKTSNRKKLFKENDA